MNSSVKEETEHIGATATISIYHYASQTRCIFAAHGKPTWDQMNKTVDGRFNKNIQEY